MPADTLLLLVSRARHPTCTCMLRLLLFLFWSCLPLSSFASAVQDLTPSNWHHKIMQPHARWLLYFAVDGCKHCAALKPMMEKLAEPAAQEGLRVGRVNATAHNGVARTLGLRRFPTILYVESHAGGSSQYYEFEGRRSIPGMLEFSRHPPPGARAMPDVLQPDVSEWWLLAEALWPPLKIALTWSVGIAIALKLLATCCLKVLERKGRALRDAGGASTVKDESRKAQ